VTNPTLSVCLITQNMAHFLPCVLENVAPIADEIVVVDSFSTDGTLEYLQAVPGVRLFQQVFSGHFGIQKNFAISQARCDWILIVDSDELLGDRLREEIPRLTRSLWFTHYKFARYWICKGPPWHFVDSPAHMPDFQLRLFRNRRFFRYETSKVVHTHFPRKGRGACRKRDDLHIFHFDFMLRDRASREEKVARYLNMEPGTAGTSMMYLYEDTPHQVKPCVEILSSKVATVVFAGS